MNVDVPLRRRQLLGLFWSEVACPLIGLVTVALFG